MTSAATGLHTLIVVNAIQIKRSRKVDPAIPYWESGNLSLPVFSLVPNSLLLLRCYSASSSICLHCSCRSACLPIAPTIHAPLCDNSYSCRCCYPPRSRLTHTYAIREAAPAFHPHMWQRAVCPAVTPCSPTVLSPCFATACDVEHRPEHRAEARV